MDNLYFGLTKPELIELVAGTDESASLGAQAELDRRAAKKAAKRQVVVDPYTALRNAINAALHVDTSDIEMETILETLNELVAGLPID